MMQGYQSGEQNFPVDALKLQARLEETGHTGRRIP